MLITERRKTEQKYKQIVCLLLPISSETCKLVDSPHQTLAGAGERQDAGSQLAQQRVAEGQGEARHPYACERRTGLCVDTITCNYHNACLQREQVRITTTNQRQVATRDTRKRRPRRLRFALIHSIYALH